MSPFRRARVSGKVAFRVSYYEVLLALHIAGVVVWVGGGTALTILGSRFAHVGDATALKGLFEQAGWLSSRVFTPVSLLVLVFGILLVIEGPWSFDQLWVVLGLAGFAATLVTGAFLLLPRAAAINELIAREDGISAEAAAAIRELFLLTRIDYAVLFVVVLDMALKPTGEDVWTLVAMAAVLVVAAALVVRGLRAQGGSVLRQTG